MIVDVLLKIVTNVLNILLFPLQAIDIGINFLGNISIIKSFIGIVVYILPFNNLLPLIILTISIFTFRIIVSFIKTIWDLLPIF